MIERMQATVYILQTPAYVENHFVRMGANDV
jgi:hypothetical protein